MASITIRGLEKNYGDAPALRGISLDIAEGEFMALVGPSGCGKSTLLRSVAGLETVDAGEIRLGDDLINEVAPKDRNIAMVFQNYALYPHMTVARNLGFSLRLKGVARADIERRVAEVAQILGLASLLERYPRQLSGGQRQRVAMGRAIVRSPRAFLFDEPLSNLDAKLRVQMRTEIKVLHQRLGATMLYVTHDQVEAMTMADRVAVLRDGRIEQVGAPLDLYDRPANAFVAGFIGSPAMNFMDGHLDLSGRHSVVTDDGLRLPITRAPEDAHGRRVTYGVRPEDFLIVADGGVGGEVQVVEPTGSDTQISVRIGRQDVVASVRDRRPLRPGQHLALAPREGGAHLFDADSGQRIN